MQTKILVILLVGSFLPSLYSRHHYQDKTSRFCGENLANMLQILCNDRVGKRSSPLSLGESNEYGYGIIDLDTTNDYRLTPWSYFKSRNAASALIPKRFRRQPGIVEECCLKPCSINELMGYCD